MGSRVSLGLQQLDREHRNHELETTSMTLLSEKLSILIWILKITKRYLFKNRGCIKVYKLCWEHFKYLILHFELREIIGMLLKT